VDNFTPKGLLGHLSIWLSSKKDFGAITTSQGGINVNKYVDCFLLSGQEKRVVKKATNKLFNFLGKQGLGVLKNKLQYGEREVRYLRHLMSEGKQDKCRKDSGNC